MNTGSVVSTFHFIFMVKGEVMLVKGHTGTQDSAGVDSFIHIFGARLGSVVSAKPRPLCP